VIRRAVSRVLSMVRPLGRPGSLTVAAEPDATLMASAAALRRLGARITRYDIDASTLEAKDAGATIRLEVRAAGHERSRIEVASDGAVRPLVRRLRAELAHPTGETTR
jgi:hypothetical protein